MDDFIDPYADVTKLYPDAKFDICFKLHELDIFIYDQKTLLLVLDHRCCCYRNCPTPDDYLIVNSSNNQNITIRDVINQLVKSGYDPDCDHRFLESIYHKQNNIFEAFFGS